MLALDMSTTWPKGKQGIELEELLSEAQNYPERRLFIAIALTLLEDYEHRLSTIAIGMQTKRCVSVRHRFELVKLCEESESTQFEEICEVIGIHISHFIRKLRQMDERYNLASVKWTNEIEQLNSQTNSAGSRANSRRLKAH